MDAEMSLKHDQWIWEQDVSHLEKLVLLALSSRCFKAEDNFAWPSQSWLASRCRANIDSVGRALRTLVERGLLKAHKKAGEVARYELLTPDTTSATSDRMSEPRDLIPDVESGPSDTVSENSDVGSEHPRRRVGQNIILLKDNEKEKEGIQAADAAPPVALKRKGKGKRDPAEYLQPGQYPEVIASPEARRLWDDWMEAREEKGHERKTIRQANKEGKQLKDWGRDAAFTALKNATLWRAQGLQAPSKRDVELFLEGEDREAEEAMFRRGTEEVRKRMEAQAATNA